MLFRSRPFSGSPKVHLGHLTLGPRRKAHDRRQPVVALSVVLVLSRLNFKVTVHENLRREKMADALDEFGAQIRSGAWHCSIMPFMA